MPKKKKTKKSKKNKKSKKVKVKNTLKSSSKPIEKKSNIPGPDEKPEIKKIKNNLQKNVYTT